MVVEPRGEGGGNKEMGGEEREDNSNSRQQGGRGRIRELAEEARKEGREAAKASLSAFEVALAVSLFQFKGTLHNILFHRIFRLHFCLQKVIPPLQVAIVLAGTWRSALMPVFH